MRTPILPRLVLLAGVSSMVGLFGCGGTTEYSCNPSCPAGTTCTAGGCVADNPGGNLDLSVPGDLAMVCPSSCVGATPYCNAQGLCVPCLEDKHCPLGQYCRAVGQSAACVPGCTDDSRCDGGKKCCDKQCIDTSKDGSNCGTCGTTCMAPHAASACMNGVCTTGTCRAGYGDCDGNPANGCETNVRTDNRNCAACGASCDFPHALGACASGCYIAACAYGYDNCNEDEKDGCEVATSSDVKNCGGCGMACAQVSRAQIGCVLGACQLVACNNGFSDCNGTYNDGCETATGTDVRNCGKCGNQCAQGQVCVNSECTCPVCNFPNAKAGCFGNMCGIASCNAGWANCDNQNANGCERNIDSDAANCGGCGVKCAQGLVCVKGSCTCPQCNIPNAKSVCINNVCVLDSCLPGYANCDGQQGNGCEVQLDFDANNCAACGKQCAQGAICCNGVCTMGGGGGGGNLHGSQTFNFTGQVQTFTVPNCVYALTLEAWGAQGGDSDCCQGSQVDGGLGGYAIGTMTVKPGDTVSIFVGAKGVKGGAGGYNGGAKAGQYGGGGGGGSDVRVGAATLNDRVLIAGGGGGGNCGCPDHGAGGGGGGQSGDNGISNQGFVPGGGGTQNGGGTPGSMSGAGSLGQGGGGGAYHEAGGGGGYYGGGGAYAAGGGGGSAYITGLSNASTSNGMQTGDGKVVLTW